MEAVVELGACHLGREGELQVLVELVEVPVFGVLPRAERHDEPLDGVFDRLDGRLAQVFPVEDLLAAPVDDLALLVHHLVVLEDVLADLEVAVLDGPLGPLDGLRDHAGLERHVVGKGAVHDPAHRAGREEPHEVVLEGEVEAALAGVALPAGAAPQLVVDPAALVAFGAEDVEAAELSDLVAVGGASGLVTGDALGQPVRALVGVRSLREEVAAGETLGVATEEDVDAAPGHVGGHGHRSRLPGLGDDVGFHLVLLGVQDGVGDAASLEDAGQELGLLDRDRADEHRLTGLSALVDVVGHGLELRGFGLVDEVGLVGADHRLVRRDGDDLEPVGVCELAGFRRGGAGHPGELLVHPEVVLEGDRGEGLVLLLDPHRLLRLDRLVQTLAPPAALEDPAGELVDDLHLAVLDDVVDVALEELLGPQRGLQLVHEVLVHVLVEVVDSEGLLDPADAVLGGDDGLLRLVDLVVAVALQRLHDARELVVQLLGVVGGTGDDQRGAGLVDEDGVDLVDDAEGVAALHLVLAGGRHVVAEVVEPELVVRPVRDIGAVREAFRVVVIDVGDDDTDVEAEGPVDLAHPLGVTAGQVVVHGDDVDAVAG